MLLAPLLAFALVLMSPYSARLSLMLHGRPFARIVPKEKLDIFKFVSTDSFADRAIVFSNDKAVGWICLPTLGGFASFVPFSDNPNVVDVPFEPWFQFPLMIAWWLRWWLLPAQVVILLLWLHQKRKERSIRVRAIKGSMTAASQES
ncbi:MAG: hypothetical protein ABR924_15755 [Terracidiphilus sp.]